MKNVGGFKKRVRNSPENKQKHSEQEFTPKRREFIPREGIWAQLSAATAKFGSLRPMITSVAVFQFIAAQLEDDPHDKEVAILAKAFTSWRPFVASFLALTLMTIGAYPVVGVYLLLKPKMGLEKMYTFLWGLGTLVFCVGYFTAGTFYCSYFRMGFCTAILVVANQMVFWMKMHAFVHWTIEASLQETKENQKTRMESFSSYLFFLFAPVLVYRPVYPRKEKRNWKKVALLFMDLSAWTYLTLVIVSRIYLPSLEQWHLEHPGNPHDLANLRSYASLVLRTLPVAFFSIITLGYNLFHCILNMNAELNRFADCRFQGDFWNRSSFRKSFAVWNYPVHDWLYEYVYTPIYQCPWGKSRQVAGILALLFSYLFHELLVNLARRSWGWTFVPFYFGAALQQLVVDQMFEDKEWKKDLRSMLYVLNMVIGASVFASHLYINDALNGPIETWDDWVVEKLQPYI